MPTSTMIADSRLQGSPGVISRSSSSSEAVADGSGAEYFAIYLTKKLSNGEMVLLSDIWGHYHSRIVDNFELISYWAAEEDGVTVPAR